MELKFSGFTRKPLVSFVRLKTGKIPQGETVTIHVAVPPGARRLSVRADQIHSDAMLRLGFEGQHDYDNHSPELSIKNPVAGEHTATLTADREVEECDITVTVPVYERVFPSDH